MGWYCDRCGNVSNDKWSCSHCGASRSLKSGLTFNAFGSSPKASNNTRIIEQQVDNSYKKVKSNKEKKQDKTDLIITIIVVIFLIIIFIFFNHIQIFNYNHVTTNQVNNKDKATIDFNKISCNQQFKDIEPLIGSAHGKQTDISLTYVYPLDNKPKSVSINYYSIIIIFENSKMNKAELEYNFRSTNNVDYSEIIKTLNCD